MSFFENNAHAAVTQEIIFLGGFEAENYQGLLYMYGTCIHMYYNMFASPCTDFLQQCARNH